MKKILIITRGKLVSLRQMPQGTTGDFEFHLNSMEGRPDFVAVIGKGVRQPTTFPVGWSRLLLLTNEPHDIFEYPAGYCRQFGTVCSCQQEMKGDNVVYTPAFLPWHIGYVPEADGRLRFTMNYEDVATAQPPKRKLISVISSRKALCRGHVDRLRFIKRLQELYGDQIDVFGRGYCDFGDKWDVLAPYKYHIVIENSCSDYYWTEKPGDCFLAGTFPLYHGCTNMADYFPREAYVPIDIRNFEQTTATIDHVLASNLYEQRQEALAEAKQLMLGRYNFFNMLADQCRRIQAEHPHPAEEQTTILPARQLSSLHNLWLYTLGRNYYKLLARL